ncbi:MAG: SPFH domain-containing protein [Deltaproteobacteria bacterium]|jgi:regulator of protease activity HflC (stomatin/prohibitin superfamily)|nr:SPFH domain-containing protein [Deltaproteobacteria bacterium]
MFGIKFMKVNPSTYIIHYRNGRVVREGAGLSFFYYAPSSSLVSLPLGSESLDMIFTVPTRDHQPVSVQGQLSYRIVSVHKLVSLLNFTVSSKGSYVSDDPEKLGRNLLNLAQKTTRRELADLPLKEALLASERIAQAIKAQSAQSQLLSELGLEIIDVSVLAVRPNKETERALEAQMREALLQEADEAVCLRRNAAIEQERLIKENELNTEIAVETKKREIMETHLEAKKAELAKRQEIDEDKIRGQIVLERKNEELVAAKTENEKKMAESRAFGLSAVLKPLSETDPRIVQALASRDMNPAQLVAMSFRELAEQAQKIGQLNISPDLLSQLLER